MPHPRYVPHGDLAPYLEQYPGLFGLYRDDHGDSPRPRVWSSKARRDAGARYRDQGIIYLDMPPVSPPEPPSRFSPPSPASASTSSTLSPPRPRRRLPTFADRVRAGQAEPPTAWKREPKMDGHYAPPPPLREAKRMTTDGWAGFGSHMPTFAQRMRAQGAPLPRSLAVPAPEPHRRHGSERRHAEPVPSVPRTKGRSHRRHAPPTPPPIVHVVAPGPTHVQRRNAVRRSRGDGIQRVPAAASMPMGHSGAASVRHSSPARLSRPRSSHAIAAEPGRPTPPLPQLDRLDHLIAALATLSLASSTHLAPAHAHIYADRPLPVLPHDLQRQLTSLHPYLALSPAEMLPDAAPLSRRKSLRLFTRGRSDKLRSGDDAQSRQLPESTAPAGGADDPLAARWRVLQRLGRDPATHRRRHYLPTLVAVLTALEVARHVRRCVEAWSPPLRPRRVLRKRGALDATHAAWGMRGYGEQHGRHDSGYGGVQDMVGDRSSPDVFDATAFPGAGVTPPGTQERLPEPLAARVRRLARMETRLRWQIALIGEALWKGGNVAHRIQQCRAELEREGFLQRWSGS